ncbi:[FeFe] hydrogenase H-cluster maturation GTPase HydF [Candidatus Margulisiibacteriota bacterium]
MNNETPKGNRPHLAVFGKRNSGKSSFINAFIDQDLSIVSSTPGTTTDPVEKAYELQPFGPVVLIDTAGIDDAGDLGQKRIARTRKVLDRTDFAFLLVEDNQIGQYEAELIAVFLDKKIPWVIILNKEDLLTLPDLDRYIADIKANTGGFVLSCSTLKKPGLEKIKAYTAEILGSITPLIADLVAPPDTVVLVVPIDKEAPQGRLILPQVQVMRELLDADTSCVVVKEKGLDYTLNNVLKIKPKLVVTDSQAFLEVDANVPGDILMTSFSILFARQKGDLRQYVEGVKAIDNLQNGDNVLIAELCSHRPIGEDIGRVKIPRWLKQYKGVTPNFEFAVGKDFPDDLSKYKLIIQCGGCMVNRQLILSRIARARSQNIPITNYGVTIAYLFGILDRAVKSFSLS